jgi:hypothetical protein
VLVRCHGRWVGPITLSRPLGLFEAGQGGKNNGAGNRTRASAEAHCNTALERPVEPCAAMMTAVSPDRRVGIDLYWLPLGAGGNFVRLNGRVYEAIKARLDRRPVCDLYHSALQVFVPEGRYVVENTPVVDDQGRERGVVIEGPVGARWAGRLRMFRYEMRRWRDGVIPDIAEAVDSPRRLSSDLRDARHLLELMQDMPVLVWGRDELGAGEMWNSNSMISWLIARTGLDVNSIGPPAGGRAPGWSAGIVAAARELEVIPRGGLLGLVDGLDDGVSGAKETAAASQARASDKT